MRRAYNRNLPKQQWGRYTCSHSHGTAATGQYGGALDGPQAWFPLSASPGKRAFLFANENNANKKNMDTIKQWSSSAQHIDLFVIVQKYKIKKLLPRPAAAHNLVVAIIVVVVAAHDPRNKGVGSRRRQNTPFVVYAKQKKKKKTRKS